jgi:hypothetical protein
LEKTAEHLILKDITRIADRLRAMRSPGTQSDRASIQALEAEARGKWDQLRALRAGPTPTDLPPPTRRSSRN